MTNNDPKQKIMDVATGHFAAKGFFGARMQAIADEAGVNKAMLHYYYSTKRDLYIQVLAGIYSRIFTGMTSIIAKSDSREGRIRQLIEFFFDFWSERQEILVLVEREMLDGGEALDPALEIAMSNTGLNRISLRSVFESLVGGELPGRLELGHTVFSLVGTMLISFLGRPIFGRIWDEDVSDVKAYLARRRQNVLGLVELVLQTGPGRQP